MWSLFANATKKEPSMIEVSIVGLDIAKRVFQVHGVDRAGEAVLRRQVRRDDLVKFFGKLSPCVIGLEACATSHYWARQLAALGHQVRLMPPTRVKPYVKWGRKSDKVDAAACCEAVTRPSMQFVPVKTEDQQAALMLHRARQLLVEQRTRLGNALRAHLAEFGIVAAKGAAGLAALLAMLADAQNPHVPAAIRPILAPLAVQWCCTREQIASLERQILAWHKSNADSVRLATIPQIGPIIASALVATAGDAKRFKNGRQFSAWLGIVPSQNGTGGKIQLGPITKTGDRYLRQLLVIAATGMIRRVRAEPDLMPWLAGLLARMPAKQAAVALANKLARIAWALLVKSQVYKPAVPAETAVTA
jgi:transposase